MIDCEAYMRDMTDDQLLSRYYSCESSLTIQSRGFPAFAYVTAYHDELGGVFLEKCDTVTEKWYIDGECVGCEACDSCILRDGEPVCE